MCQESALEPVTDAEKMSKVLMKRRRERYQHTECSAMARAGLKYSIDHFQTAGTWLLKTRKPVGTIKLLPQVFMLVL